MARSNLLKNQIAKIAFSSFSIKILSLSISFLINVFLARLLGTSDYGTYVYAIAWVGFLIIPASLGLNEYLVREVAAHQQHFNKQLPNPELSRLNGLLRWSNHVSVLLSVGIALLTAFIIWILHPNATAKVSIVLWMTLASMPFSVLTMLRQGTLRGLNRVLIGELPEQLIRPILFAVFVGIMYFLLKGDLNVYWVMGLYILSIIAAFGIGAELLRRTLPASVKQATPTYNTPTWFKGTLPFLSIVGLYVINQQTDVLMLGTMKGPEAAGIYTVVGRGVQLLQFILAAVCAAVGPTMVNHFTSERLDQLKKLVRGSSRLAFGASFLLTAAFVLFGKWFLMIFGVEFISGYSALIILCVGHLLSSGLGMAGFLLLMTGYERDTAMATGATAVLNVVLNALLIPQFDLEGAAIATATTLVLRGFIFLYFGCKRLKFAPSVFF
ncbi:flippase [Oscillatoria sp. FACHB-1407]|uniref:flippase n=1 Tax=Oscillatoria sp. FACHB-1407 TaxID=2692847 RepID=UPI001687A039|nr:flippase [Oscillatoria sp. FACHB-1407]MBD2459690.1 flippase [Oscillatoria sp. FACHB-1407]